MFTYDYEVCGLKIIKKTRRIPVLVYPSSTVAVKIILNIYYLYELLTAFLHTNRETHVYIPKTGKATLHHFSLFTVDSTIRYLLSNTVLGTLTVIHKDCQSK